MLVTDRAILDTMLKAVSQTKCLAIDTETNFTELHQDRFLVGVSICTDDEQTFYIPVQHKPPPQMDLFTEEGINFRQGASELFDLLDSMEIDLIFHNAKFDLVVLEMAGLWKRDNVDNVHDTLLMHHLIDENPPHGLKPLAKQLLKMEEAPQLAKTIKSMGSLYGWECVYPLAMAQYAEQDALMTMRLYKVLLPIVEKEELVENARTDIEFMHFLRKIEGRGVRLDMKLTAQRAHHSRERMDQIRNELGFDPGKSSQLIDKLYSEPPLGLGLKPSAFTPSGRIQVNEEVLAGINHPVAGLVLEYRANQKATSTWYDGFVEKADLAGRLHPNFKQHGTVTGRLSCENPNLQQIPREYERVKALFLPTDGYELWEFDFSQIELRLAAIYGSEDGLLTAFNAGRDVHQSVADAISISRHQAKTLNFAILYGAGAGKVSEQLGTSFATAKTYLDNYRSTYPGLARVAQHAANVAESNGWVKYWTGRRRHFKWPSEYHKAFNSIIQGGAFEIVKRAGLNLGQVSYWVVNQVHDSYWLELEKPSPADIEKVCQVMSAWTTEAFDLEFTVDAKRLK